MVGWVTGWRLRRAKRVKRGALVVLLALSSVVHLALAHSGPTPPLRHVAPPPPEPVVVPIPDAPPPLADTARPTSWLPPAVGGCRGVRRCVAARKVPAATPDLRAREQALHVGDVQYAREAFVHGTRPEWIAAAPLPSAETLYWPVDNGHFGRGVGLTRRGALHRIPHQGVDVVAPAGSHARAAMDAVVVYADNGLKGYGNLVILAHADGTITFYAHLREAWVAAGQTIHRGQTVGLVGATGLAYGPHLHFELRQDGEYLNPMARFDHVVHRGDAVEPDAAD